jgi:acetylornithine deacetylase/succinyl-diaminopimelate desuccinylase-like protein
MWRKPLINKNKARARAWLYGSTGAVFLIATALFIGTKLIKPAAEYLAWNRPVEEFEAMPEIALFQEYLRIDTSADGSEVLGAEFLARKLAEVGIESTIERIGKHNANLWAIVEGEDPRALVLHNHIDVDPIAHPERWNTEPFGAVIRPPWIYGRGAFDMKSVTIAQLIAMRALAQRDERPKRTVIFLATGDEETGSRYGLSWFMREHPDLASRFETVLTEGGVVEAVATDQVKYWGLEFAQKRYLTVTACHPKRERLAELYDDLQNLDHAELKRFVSPQMRRFLSIYGPTREHPALHGPLEDLDGLLTDARFATLPSYLQLMFRGDVRPLALEADREGNGYRLFILLALMPGDDFERAKAELLPDWMTHGVSLSFDFSSQSARESSLDHPDFAAIIEFMSRDVPNTVHGPMLIPTALTDARIFRHHGIATYGYSPFLILSTDTLQMKGPNERMALPAFLDGVRRYADLVRYLTSP